MDHRYRQRVAYETQAVSLLADYGHHFGMVTTPPVPFELILERHLGFTLHVINIADEFGIDGLAAVIPDKKVLLLDEAQELRRITGDPAIGRFAEVFIELAEASIATGNPIAF